MKCSGCNGDFWSEKTFEEHNCPRTSPPSWLAPKPPGSPRLLCTPPPERRDLAPMPADWNEATEERIGHAVLGEVFAKFSSPDATYKKWKNETLQRWKKLEEWVPALEHQAKKVTAKHRGPIQTLRKREEAKGEIEELKAAYLHLSIEPPFSDESISSSEQAANRWREVSVGSLRNRTYKRRKDKTLQRCKKLEEQVPAPEHQAKKVTAKHRQPIQTLRKREEAKGEIEGPKAAYPHLSIEPPFSDEIEPPFSDKIEPPFSDESISFSEQAANRWRKVSVGSLRNKINNSEYYQESGMQAFYAAQVFREHGYTGRLEVDYLNRRKKSTILYGRLRFGNNKEYPFIVDPLLKRVYPEKNPPPYVTTMWNALGPFKKTITYTSFEAIEQLFPLPTTDEALEKKYFNEEEKKALPPKEKRKRIVREFVHEPVRNAKSVDISNLDTSRIAGLYESIKGGTPAQDLQLAIRYRLHIDKINPREQGNTLSQATLRALSDKDFEGFASALCSREFSAVYERFVKAKSLREEYRARVTLETILQETHGMSYKLMLSPQPVRARLSPVPSAIGMVSPFSRDDRTRKPLKGRGKKTIKPHHL